MCFPLASETAVILNPASDFAGGPQGDQEREAKNTSGDALGGYIILDSSAIQPTKSLVN